jgi:hypothetical protein
MLKPVVLSKRINKAAKRFRTRLHEDELAYLLKEALPREFQALDDVLARLEKIQGPDIRFDTSKFLSAVIARGLIAEFSKTPPTGSPKGSLRSIAPLVYEFLTGNRSGDLKRAIDAVLKFAGTSSSPAAITM